MQCGQLGDEEFRRDLDAYYENLTPSACKDLVGLDARLAVLDKPGGYKSAVLRLPEDPVQPSRFDFWARRLRLLQHMGIKIDVMTLKGDSEIPPHGHHGVVSGFYVIEGRVAIRHYDRVECRGNGVFVRKVVDRELGAGGYTTNSEFHQNIHWLRTLSPKAYFFRMSVTGVPGPTFGGVVDPRVYVDPTVPPGESGLNFAPYIDAATARAIAFAV